MKPPPFEYLRPADLDGVLAALARGGEQTKILAGGQSLIRMLAPKLGVDGLRGALSGGFAFGAATDFAVLGGLAAILLAIGAYLFSKIEV